MNALPNGCSRGRAERLLVIYDGYRTYGYKNQQIAAGSSLRRACGMGVRDLRRWLLENQKPEALGH